ncbi:hypothetical protein [Pseudofulvibacter geojedonensis]|uniref:Uncharacterized protein n=1 Tax=Pseudofulvibacter geojedonensis TaxID=1123758 RepID=A0ABW3I147_9FLAO
MYKITQSLLGATLFLLASSSFAQVGIGTTTPVGALDISSSTGGLVPPRVQLNDINDATTVTNQDTGGAPVAGTFVWNNGASGTSPNNVAAGLYYWDGTRWVAFAGSPGGFDWALKGNSGTNNGTDFLGTTDAEPLVVKVNNIERMRMGTTETVVNEDAQNYDFRVEGTGETHMFFVDSNNDHVFIRQASPFPTVDMFTSFAAANDYAINGYTSGQGNAAVYGRHETAATTGNTNVGGAFDGGAHGFPIIADYTIGVSAAGSQLGGLISSNSTSGDRWGLISRNDNGSGAIGSEARLAGISDVPRPPAEGGGPTSNEFYGGFFNGGQTTGDFAYVGLNYNGTDYKITGGGSVSTIVKDAKGHERILFCPEAPEILFEDYGVAKLTNGTATVKIDPIFAQNIVVNEKHPLKVFIQLEGDCKGVYVTNKSKNSFTVKELNGGNSNISFSWHIVANRIDNKDASGKVTSKHEGVRFPYGPKKLEPLKYGKAKVKNRK